MKWIEAYFAMQVLVPIICFGSIFIGIVVYIVYEIYIKHWIRKFELWKAYRQGKLAKLKGLSGEVCPYKSKTVRYTSIGTVTSSNLKYQQWIRGYNE